MNLERWILCGLLCCAAHGVLAQPTGSAATYPGRTIRIVVPFAPGGATDTIARVMAQKLNAAWGQGVVVDNRPGAGGNLGTEIVAKSTPDGHTLLMAINSHAVNASLYRKLPYDPIKDFTPVSLVATSPNVLVVHPSLPVRSVKELVAMARTRPGQLTYASAGAGSGSHLAGELLREMARVDIVHVPYKGIGPAMIDLIGGQVTFSFAALPVGRPHVQAGKLKALAVTNAKRSPLAPELPTVAEAGFEGFDVFSWFGLLAPAQLPADVMSKLHGAIVQAVQMQDVRDRLVPLGLELIGNRPEQFADFIRSDWAQWDRLIKSAGIRIE